MAWWGYLLLVLGLYVLAAGLPWLVYLIVHRFLIHRAPFLENEAVTRGRLKDALAAQRAKWPSVPRLGRYREPDQKALDRLADLTTSLGDVDQLWPGLQGYTGARFSPRALALFGGWSAMFSALRAHGDLRQVRGLLSSAERQLDEVVVLEGMVADIPSAVADLADERARRIDALMAKIDEEEQTGTVGLEAMRQEIATLQLEAERVNRMLEERVDLSDEALLRADQELERIADATASLEARLAEIASQRREADALLQQGAATLETLQTRWAQLKEEGARDDGLEQRLNEFREAVQAAQAYLSSRTPQVFARSVARGQELQERLAETEKDLLEYHEVIQDANAGVAGDLDAIEDARLVVTSLAEKDLPVDGRASLEIIEEAATCFTSAEEQLQVGSLAALRESVASSTRGKALLQKALERVNETAGQAERGAALLTRVSPERLQQLQGQLGALKTELSAYEVIWQSGPMETAAAAEDALLQTRRLLEQLPPQVLAGQPVPDGELEEVLGVLQRASESVGVAEQRLGELDDCRLKTVTQREELETAVAEFENGAMATARELAPAMLGPRRQAWQAFSARFRAESSTMLDPSQVDYAVALGTWLPTAKEELQALMTQHEQEVSRLERSLRDQRRRLDRSWRKLQATLDKDPRRPQEDVDELFRRFNEWWERAESARQAPELQDLVDVEGPAIEASIGRALNQVEEGQRTNRELTRDLARLLRTLDRDREQVARRGSASNWPGLEWDVRQADELWRRANEAATASADVPAMAEANSLMAQAIDLAQQASEAYEQERIEAHEAVARLDATYQEVTRMVAAATSRARELGEQGPSPALESLEDRLEAARRDLDAAREATSVAEATQRLQLAQEMLGPVSG